jgi:uncharacterized protein
MSPKLSRDWLHVGQVFHRRLRPVGHRFAYRVFYLRFPLSALAQLENRWFKLERFGLMSFYRADHGSREARGDLLAWSQALLHSHGIADADGETELQCFPRVLGYVFNPVSFWYCHTRAGQLRAVIAEVNNTFGERHAYVLEAPQGVPIAQGQLLAARKVFHVSPFFPIEGGYQFRFLQVMRQGVSQSVARIDYGDAAGPLLLTGISGTARALTAGNVLATWLRMPLFTLAVVARIHWQALRLFSKRVRFFSKPAPPAEPSTHGIPPSARPASYPPVGVS